MTKTYDNHGAGRYLEAAACATNLLGLTIPMLIMVVYDRVLPKGDPVPLAPLAILACLALCLELTVRTASAGLAAHARAHLEAQTTREFHRRILNSGPREKDGEPALRRLDKYHKLIDIGEASFGDAAIARVDVPFAFAYFGLVFLISPAVCAIFLLLTSLSVLAMRGVAYANFTLSDERDDLDGRRRAFAEEVLSRMETVKAFSLEAFMERRYERLTLGCAELHGTLAANSDFLRSIAASATAFTPFFLGATGAVMVIADDLSIGALAATIMLGSRAIQSILRFTSFAEARRNGDAAQETKPVVGNDLAARPVQSQLDSISEVQTVGLFLRGADDDEALLNNAHFQLRRGEAVAITGQSGAGKSLLLAALAGHIAPSSGCVLINGRQPDCYDPASLRRNIAFAAQQPLLLDGTILENLTRFRPDQHWPQAYDLARRFGVDAFLCDHHLGYDMQVGREMSHTLPVALVARISIIASLVGQPSLILFDEANISLDFAADRELCAYLAELRPYVAMVMVTHRPSYQAICDRVFQIDKAALRLAKPRSGTPGSRTMQQNGKLLLTPEYLVARDDNPETVRS